MSARFILHTTYLIFASLLTFVWTQTPTLSSYTLQLVAILILTYFASNFIANRKAQPASLDASSYPRGVITLDLIILTIIILLLISSTGGLSSPLFFTSYFLLFGVALLFEIEATLALTAILLVFLSLLPSTDLTQLTHLAELLALIMITPLAIYTAHEHEQAIKQQIARQKAELAIQSEETDTLLFLSLNLKQTLTSALDQLSLLIPKTRLPQTQDELKKLYQDLKALYHSAQELEQAVDQETD